VWEAVRAVSVVTEAAMEAAEAKAEALVAAEVMVVAVATAAPTAAEAAAAKEAVERLVVSMVAKALAAASTVGRRAAGRWALIPASLVVVEEAVAVRVVARVPRLQTMPPTRATLRRRGRAQHRETRSCSRRRGEH
jgi:hypothetical protein